jgi:hypothetical protein
LLSSCYLSHRSRRSTFRHLGASQLTWSKSGGDGVVSRYSLERQLGHIAGVTEMTSASNLGSTSVTLQFELNRNIDAAARDVQAAINGRADIFRQTCQVILPTEK